MKKVNKRSYPVEKCMCFNSFHPDNYVLSNMFPCELEHNGIHFKSSEMMYWWMMFAGDGEDRAKVRRKILQQGGIRNGFQCKKIGQENSGLIDAGVAEMEFEILELCLIAKVKGCRDFRGKLRESSGKWLVEEAWWDPERYGAVLNKKSGCMEGGNACGRIMMKVRDMFLRGDLGEFDDGQ